MNDFEKKFSNLRNELTLSSDERASMRAYLASQMHTPTKQVPVASPYPYLAFFMQPARMIALVLIVAVAGGSTTTLAAEDALPGEALYSVKVQVKERLESALAFSTVKKADAEIRHAEERLREIQLLAATDKNEDIVMAVEDAQAYLNAAKGRINTLMENDPALADAQSTFAFALSANADIIEAQALERTDAAGVSLTSLARAVRGESEEAVAENSERAEKVIDKARERVVSRDLEASTRETLLGELAHVEAELAKAHALSSLKGFARAERHAYRILALADSAERISDKTGKQIAISFSKAAPEEESAPITAAARVKEPAVDVMATTMMLSAPEEPTYERDDDNEYKDEDDDDRKLRFRVVEDDDEEEDKDADTSDSSGKGSNRDARDSRD